MVGVKYNLPWTGLRKGTVLQSSGTVIGADEQGSPTSSRHVAADRLLVGGARAQLDRGDADAKRAVVARVGDVRVAQ